MPNPERLIFDGDLGPTETYMFEGVRVEVFLPKDSSAFLAWMDQNIEKLPPDIWIRFKLSGIYFILHKRGEGFFSSYGIMFDFGHPSNKRISIKSDKERVRLDLENQAFSRELMKNKKKIEELQLNESRLMQYIQQLWNEKNSANQTSAEVSPLE